MHNFVLVYHINLQLKMKEVGLLLQGIVKLQIDLSRVSSLSHAVLLSGVRKTPSAVERTAPLYTVAFSQLLSIG